MAKRSDNYADVEFDDLTQPTAEDSGWGVSSGPGRFTLLSGFYSHPAPPTQGPAAGGFTIGDDEDDDDDGIDVSIFTERIASFGSLAGQYAHRRDLSKNQVGFADVDDSSDSDLTFDLTARSLRLSVDDLHVNASPVKDAAARYGSAGSSAGSGSESGGSPGSPGPGLGLRRIMTLPSNIGDLAGMGAQSPAAEIKDGEPKAQQLDVAEAASPPPMGGVGDASSPGGSPAGGLGLPRRHTVHTSLGEMAQEEPKPSAPPAVPVAPASAALAPASAPGVASAGVVAIKEAAPGPYRSRILSSFFGQRAEHQVSAIKEEGAEGVASPSITEQAEQMSAKKWGFGGYSNQKATKVKVKNRDINMWAPGGT